MSIRTEILVLISALGLATYLPRLLPFLLEDRLRFSVRFSRFLELIPCSVMSALVFPGILNTDPDHPIIGIAGGLSALIAALFRLPLIVCVLIAVFCDFLVYSFLI